MIHRIDPNMSRFGDSVDLRFGASNLQVQISSKQRLFGTSGTRFRVLSPLYCWWFRNPSLVEVGSLCRCLQGFIHLRWMALGFPYVKICWFQVTVLGFNQAQPTSDAPIPGFAGFRAAEADPSCVSTVGGYGVGGKTSWNRLMSFGSVFFFWNKIILYNP